MISRTYFFGIDFFGLLAFANAIRHPFVHDDVIFILNNPHITELRNWVEAFKVPAASGGLNTYYRPVLEIIYRIEYRLFGPHPFGFHLINVIVHIINGLLLFSLLQRLSCSPSGVLGDRLYFFDPPCTDRGGRLHFRHIKSLDDTGDFAFALHAYLNEWHAASLLCFVIAFLSKEQAILFVPLVMVIDSSRGKKNFPWWFFLGIAACMLLWLRQSITGASLFKDITVSPGELYLRLAAIPRDIGMYLRLVFFPYDLHYYRNTDILKSNTIAWALALISVLGTYFTFLIVTAGTPIAAVLGLGWFLPRFFRY